MFSPIFVHYYSIFFMIVLCIICFKTLILSELCKPVLQFYLYLLYLYGRIWPCKWGPNKAYVRVYVFFLGFFVLNRVRVSNPQQLTFTQIMDEYPSPSPWHYVPFYWGSGSDMIQFKSLIKLSCENDACLDTVNSLVH